MSKNTEPKLFKTKDVHQQEQDAVTQRRQAAGLRDGSEPPVGLALSGGGIRSAAFNLGLLQSLHEHDLLRQVDYLSAVSGGGYVGAYLPEIAPTARAADNAAAAPTEKVQRLILGGLYLKRPVQLLNHWLCGTCLNLAIVFSGLMLAASVLAWCFRQLDCADAILYFKTLGIRTDIGRALVPCAVLALLWLMVRGVVFGANVVAGTRGQARVESLQARLAALTVASALMAMAALLNTSDISLNVTDGGQLDKQKEVNREAAHLRWALLALLAAALLPYLRPQDLLRSGTQPRTVVHSWVYWIASYAVLFGIPLVLFGLLARENISGSNESRPNRYQLQRNFVADWRELLTQKGPDTATVLDSSDPRFLPHLAVMMAVVEEDPADGLEELAKAKKSGDAKQEKAAIRTVAQGWAEKIRAKQAVIRELLEKDKDNRKDDLKWFWEKEGKWYWPGENWKEHPFAQWWLAQEAAAERISTRCLKSPDFYAAFQGIPKAVEKGQLPPRWTEATVQRLVELRERAGWLAGMDQLRKRQPTGGDPAKEEPNEIDALNWQMLHAYYGPVLREPSTVFATNVQPGDQCHRLLLARLSLLAFLVLGLVISLNATSMHHFYRDRLADLWLQGRDAEKLADFRAKCPHLPYLLINATANLQGVKADRKQEPLDVFVFSPLFCGSERTDYLATAEFHGGRFRLADAIAISGAAVSPAVMRDPIRMMLLFLTNSRTGQWLWNPGFWKGDDRPRWVRLCWPTALSRLWTVAFGWPTALSRLWAVACVRPERRGYLFISDGGHHENLGVESLLRRRCHLIIASDATFDPEHKFLDLMKLFRRMRVLLGMEFRNPAAGAGPPRLDRLTPQGEKTLARRHFVVTEIAYGRGTGYLVYVKPTFTGDEDPELMHYRQDNVQFPHDPTLDQFFDPRRFECYRLLGRHIGHQLADELLAGRRVKPDEPWLAFWQPPVGPDVREQLRQELDLFESNEAFRQRIIRQTQVWRDSGGETRVIDPGAPANGPHVPADCSPVSLAVSAAACNCLAPKPAGHLPAYLGGGKVRLEKLVCTIGTSLIPGPFREKHFHSLAVLAVGIHQDVFEENRTLTACDYLLSLLGRFGLKRTTTGREGLEQLEAAIRTESHERVVEALRANYQAS